MEESIKESIYFERGYNKGFSDAQESLALQFDSFQWNDVLIKEPSLEKLVIFCTDDDFQGIGYYLGRDKRLSQDNNYIFGGCVGMITGEVTHWMYAPELPKGEKL